MKPNIFRLATKELSQDGFFTWLLQWADDKFILINPKLNRISKDFIRLLLNQNDQYQITKVKAGRQWKNIDIWAEINDEFFIGIEDKTNTGEHSKQLERYKQIATNHYKSKNYKLVFIYLKTGNESKSSLEKIANKEYKIIDRNSILNILKRYDVENEIFQDFLDYLNEIDIQSKSFPVFNNIVTKWSACEGFYMELQERTSEWSHWNYVPNQTGGFLGFWYHWNKTNEIGEIYIQIENSFEKGIKLVIKIGSWNPSTELLYKLLKEIKPIAKNNGLDLMKPDKYRAGATSTLSIVKDAFPVDNDGKFEFEKFITTLNSLEKTIDEYCELKNTAGNKM